MNIKRFQLVKATFRVDVGIVHFFVEDQLLNSIKYFLCLFSNFLTLICHLHSKFFIILKKFLAEEKMITEIKLAVEGVRLELILLILLIFITLTLIESRWFLIVFEGKSYQLHFLMVCFTTYQITKTNKRTTYLNFFSLEITLNLPYYRVLSTNSLTVENTSKSQLIKIYSGCVVVIIDS